ncbi:transcriptional regulator [Motilibacter rhizosphaerae]|uniref:Transcriptional regulator n=1 Tax=Motilibacter rhizosphaerae TaxID=598652 RepID=A0A4Q7NTG3_9ACTN|nr:BTAD domain-containing putative transcriptional regulator [Motilibacter rhizosphaerae]RZS90190.1 transcriptional regulator [Motilibacter rhizosphaerae]
MQVRGSGQDVDEVGALRVQVLGRLAVHRDEPSAPGSAVEVDLGGPRRRSLLALLVLARGAPVPAERIIDLLWGDESGSATPAALHPVVSHLRRALEPARDARSREGVLRRDPAGYVLRLPPGAVDAWRFERLVSRGAALAGAAAVPLLEEALELYRGDPYAEWAGRSWATGEAGRLRELAAVARERLLAARLDTGGAAVLVPEIEKLTAEEPLREERWRLLALALYRAHRQSDALGALRRARTLLADELGVDPGPALREIEARILAQDEGLALALPPAVPTARAAEPAPTGQPAAAAPHRPVPAGEAGAIVDREPELARLAEQVGAATAGRGGALVIAGPAGIGKSRLLGEVRRQGTAAGALVLGARGSGLEREYAFGVVRQLFEPVLLDPAARERLLTGPAAAAAGVFDTAEQRAEGSFAALHGLYWLVVNLAAERPVVLVVDDLQWCDPASLRFLAYLLRRVEGLRALVASGLRTGEVPTDAALVAEVAHDPSTVSVEPGPISREGVATLVAAGLGSPAAPAFVSACHRATGGNPLLVRQLLRALESEGVRPDADAAGTVEAIGSRAVTSLVGMRLARTSEQVREVARAVAVLGDGASLPALAAFTGLAEPAAADAVAELAAAEVLRPEPPVGFVHPLVGDAVYRSLPPGHRELAHERAATVLAARGEAAERVAAHLLQVPARGSAWVVEVLTAAAATAVDRGAPEGAVAYLRRALEEPPEPAARAALLLELGRVETLGDGDAAIGHLEQAYALAGEPRLRATVAQVLGHSLVFAGERGRVTAFSRRAAAELPLDMVDARQALVALERVGAHMHGLPLREWFDAPVQPLEGDGPGARMLAVTRAWELLRAAEDRDRCVALCRDALAGGVLQQSDPGLFWVVGAFVQELADIELGSFWDDMLRRAHQQGSLFSALATHMWRGHALWRRGDLREAELALRTAIEQSQRWAAPPVAASYGEAFIVGVLLDRGDTAAARAFFDAHDDHGRMGDGERLWVEAEARLLLTEGDPARALACVDGSGEVVLGVRNPAWSPWRSLRALALRQLGREPEARALLEQELDIGRQWGASRAVGRALRLLGRPAEAVAVLSSTPWRLELAHAQHALVGAVPDAEREALLVSVLELAEECGAEGLRRSAAAQLTECGGRAPDERAGRRRLTTTQRRVAGMAADGADARQIAASLFLTPRSVEVTLEAVRAAYGVASDAELRLALAT